MKKVVKVLLADIAEIVKTGNKITINLIKENYEKIGENAKLHQIPNGEKTTIKDFYGKDVLTVEKIKNITTKDEINTILKINNDWRKKLDVTNLKETFYIYTVDEYKEFFIEFLHN